MPAFALRTALAAALLAGCAAKPAPPPSRAPDPNGLLHAMQACVKDPAGSGCTAVDRPRGFVILKDDDPAKPKAWLIVPDREVAGIESGSVFRPPVADLWRYGWAAGAALLPDEPAPDRALAINSQAGRSQNLLHIHVSCVLPEVRDALETAPVGPDWSAPILRVGDRTYAARKVASLDPSPFERLAERPGARAAMGAQSLAVVGSASGGFYLLADTTRAGAPAEAEALLDETCR